MMDAIFLLAIAIAYWAVRELVLNTFKKVAQKKLFIIGFAFVGLSIAIAVVAGSEFCLAQRPFGRNLGGSL
jgi:uncharacterized membrane protein YwzB